MPPGDGLVVSRVEKTPHVTVLNPNFMVGSNVGPV
jgi:hypothetical protein